MKLAHGTMTEVADGVFVATPNPGEGTMGVVITPEAKVAIDTNSYVGFARMVKEAIDAVYGGPWRYVVNRHSHFVHVGGNNVFERPIVASRLTAEPCVLSDVVAGHGPPGGRDLLAAQAEEIRRLPEEEGAQRDERE